MGLGDQGFGGFGGRGGLGGPCRGISISMAGQGGIGMGWSKAGLFSENIIKTLKVDGWMRASLDYFDGVGACVKGLGEL